MPLRGNAKLVSTGWQARALGLEHRTMHDLPTFGDAQLSSRRCRGARLVAVARYRMSVPLGRCPSRWFRRPPPPTVQRAFSSALDGGEPVEMPRGPATGVARTSVGECGVHPQRRWRVVRTCEQSWQHCVASACCDGRSSGEACAGPGISASLNLHDDAPTGNDRSVLVWP